MQGDMEELECVICMQLLELESIQCKSCPNGHIFHEECIDLWIARSSTCPACRAPFCSWQDIKNVIACDVDDAKIFFDIYNENSQECLDEYLIIKELSSSFEIAEILLVSTQARKSIRIAYDAYLQSEGDIICAIVCLSIK